MEVGAGAPLDPWLVRHLLLSIDDRPRNPRDRLGLEDAVRRTVDALAAVPPPLPYRPAPGVTGVPCWAFETNAWIFAPRRGDCILVDVPPRIEPLLAELDRQSLTPIAVFLTHGHLDHVGGVPELLAHVGRPMPVFVHEADVHQVASPLGVDRLLARALRLPPVDESILHPLADGERVVVAGVDVMTMHCPGHTAGTSCFRVTRNDPALLFTGDQLFATGSGRCDLAGGCAETMHLSLQQRVFTLEDDVVVLPGHGEATTIAHARRLAAIS